MKTPISRNPAADLDGGTFFRQQFIGSMGRNSLLQTSGRKIDPHGRFLRTLREHLHAELERRITAGDVWLVTSSQHASYNFFRPNHWVPIDQKRQNVC